MNFKTLRHPLFAAEENGAFLCWSACRGGRPFSVPTLPGGGLLCPGGILLPPAVPNGGRKAVWEGHKGTVKL